LVERDDGPLAAVIAGANVPDCKLLAETIEAVVVVRAAPEDVEQHRCLGAAFDNPTAPEAVKTHKYIGHIRPARDSRRDERRPGPRKTSRCVVERRLARLSKRRALLVRYDEHAKNFRECHAVAFR
jgi:hypothetical protein